MEAEATMHRPSRTASFVLGGLAAATLVTGTAAIAADADALLKAPLQGSILSDPPLFGATRGGAPWQIGTSEAKVELGGTVKVTIAGLLIPGVGVGQVRNVTATVACNGERVATTAAVPLSAAGNAQIKDDVTLPVRCLAPAVLINPNGNANVYIAATGH
jgi:hypothetical protein